MFLSRFDIKIFLSSIGTGIGIFT